MMIDWIMSNDISIRVLRDNRCGPKGPCIYTCAVTIGKTSYMPSSDDGFSPPFPTHTLKLELIKPILTSCAETTNSDFPVSE